MIRLSVVGIAACAILSACSSHQPAGYDGAPGGWSPSVASKGRSVAEPIILPETFYAAGQLFEAQGILTKAAIQYRKAAAVNHTYGAAYDRLGVTLGRLGKHPQAVEALQTAVKLNPESAAYHNNLAFEFVLLGRWTEAEAELVQAIALEPNFDRAHINLGVVQANLERFVDALTEFRKVVAEADAYYNLGLLLCGQHRYADAAGAFEHVLALNDEFEAARVQLKRIGPKLALANALEPRLTIPLETMVAEATTELPDTQPTIEVVEETPSVTEAPVAMVETSADADVMADTMIIATTTEIIDTTTEILLAADTDCPEEWEWPIDADVETLVSLTYDPTIESPAPIDETEFMADSTQESPSIDGVIPAQHAERTVMFSTIDTPAESVFSPAYGPLDGDEDCFNDSQWSFPADSLWPFIGDYPNTTWDIHQTPYDLDIESPAGTDEIGAIESENMIDEPRNPIGATGPAPSSANGQADATTWKGDDSLDMPEPEWYQRAVGKTDGAE